jgi:hypothetical protein
MALRTARLLTRAHLPPQTQLQHPEVVVGAVASLTRFSPLASGIENAELGFMVKIQ